MEITNEQIYDELLKLKRLIEEVKTFEEKQAEDEEEIKILELKQTENEEDIKQFELKQAEEQEKIAKAIREKKFGTIMEWKGAIWDKCDKKEEYIDDKTISFRCEILRQPCMFEKCPRNYTD